jgi:acetyl-CoA synthetase
MQWFTGGQLNACYNACDRHDPSKTAIIWEGNEPTDIKAITYGEMTKRVSQYANVLKSVGVVKGDRIVIYMPMVAETAYAMLACARIGAVHSVVFAGFSAESLAARIDDAECAVIMTSDYGLRGPKSIPLKKVVDDAIALLPDPSLVKTVLSYKRTGESINWVDGRDLWLDDEADKQRPYCPCEPMDAQDPLFLLYTSGSTGKPKGIMHTTAGAVLL